MLKRQTLKISKANKEKKKKILSYILYLSSHSFTNELTATIWTVQDVTVRISASTRHMAAFFDLESIAFSRPDRSHIFNSHSLTYRITTLFKCPNIIVFTTPHTQTK